MVKAAATASQAKTPTNRLSQVGKTSYNWVDRDPVMDEVCRIIIASGWTVEKIEEETTRIGRKVSRYTILGWLYKVKRPQNYGIDSVLMALGVKREFVYEDGSRYTVPQIDLSKAKFLREPPPAPVQIEPAYQPQALPVPDAQPAVALKTKTSAKIGDNAKVVPAKSRKREPAS
jgi:hypothetical protein